jgi:hypothetical protein
MKIFFLMVLSLSTFLLGCDRATLDGLNLKINADIESDYDKESETTNNDQSSETSAETTNNNPSDMAENVTEEEEKTMEAKQEEQTTENLGENQNVAENNINNEADAPMPFKEIAQCSKAGITAKTNEIFYADNSNVKSIDSKDEKQVKAWKKIYSEVEKDCNK